MLCGSRPPALLPLALWVSDTEIVFLWFFWNFTNSVITTVALCFIKPTKDLNNKIDAPAETEQVLYPLFSLIHPRVVQKKGGRCLLHGECSNLEPNRSKQYYTRLVIIDVTLCLTGYGVRTGGNSEIRTGIFRIRPYVVVLFQFLVVQLFDVECYLNLCREMAPNSCMSGETSFVVNGICSGRQLVVTIWLASSGTVAGLSKGKK